MQLLRDDFESNFFLPQYTLCCAISNPGKKAHVSFRAASAAAACVC